MSCLHHFFEFLKKLAIFVLILAIVFPVRYGSTNRQYLLIRLLHSVLSLKHSLIPDRARPTLSADYRAFENLLRMKPIEKHDPLADPITIIKNLRSTFSMGTIIPKPSQCQIDKEIFDHDDHTVKTYWIDYPPRKSQGRSDKIILYFHGGGYILNDIHSYGGFECHLSQLFNISILHVEYRLSPEYPLPAAVEDAVVVYRALLRHNISPSQLFIMGDSSGGGLALLTIQALITHQHSVPLSVIVLSPWTDLSASGESHTRNDGIDVVLRSDDTKWVSSQLLGHEHSKLSLNNPLFSPLFGSFEGFPPMYITVGTAEILEDDSRRVLKKAKEASVDVTLEEGLHMMHVYPAFFSYFPEARNTLYNINKWIETNFREYHGH